MSSRFRRGGLSGRSKRRILSHHQVGRDRLSLPHLLEKERGARVMALIAQITRPIRLHVAGIPGASLAADNDPIDATSKPGPQIKGFKQGRDG